MTSLHRPFTRRDFLRIAGCAALGTAIGPIGIADDTIPPGKRSKVILVRHKNAVDTDGQVNGKVVQGMLDDGILALLGGKSVVECWRQLVTAEDVVGIKSNEWGRLPTPAELEQAIQIRLVEAGVNPDNLGVDDRGVLGHPVFKRATALINIRPLRTHAWSGVGSLIKNYIMFDPEPPDYHGNSCASLGALWHLPIVKDKTRLNILVMLTPLFYGVGPHHFDKSFVWRYRGLLIGTDPVAVDTVGLRILQLQRREHFGEDKPIKPTAHHIAFADHKYGLGISDLGKIDVVRLGWEDGILI